jgi:hypothetical protein
VFTVLGEAKVMSESPVPKANFPLLSIPKPQSHAPPPLSAERMCIISQWFVDAPTLVVFIQAETVKLFPPSHELLPVK